MAYHTAKGRWLTMETNPFDGLISLQEAADMYGKNASTLRHAILDGRLVEGVDCKKFGKQWVITLAALKRFYGDPSPKED